MKNSIDIGELFLEICRDVQRFLTPVPNSMSPPKVQPTNGQELSRLRLGKAPLTYPQRRQQVGW